MPGPMSAPIPMAPPALELSPIDQLRSRIEASVGGSKLTTVFVGNIADGVTDELLNSLFSVCGAVKKWKRMLEASGTPKSFGFLEYELGEGLVRFLRLVPGMPLLGKGLTVKAEDATKAYLQRYQEALKAHEASDPASPSLSSTLEDDLRALDELIGILRQRNLVPAMQFVEKKVQELTVGPTEEPEPVFEHPRKETLQSEERPKQPESKKPKNASLTGWEAPIYRDRLRRWEVREASTASTREKRVTRQQEKTEVDKVERNSLIQWLHDFDDSAFIYSAIDLLSIGDDPILEDSLLEAKAPSFYARRSHWRDRRQRDLSRQVDYDGREERREMEEAKTNPNGHQGSRKSLRERPPLIPFSFTYEELIAADHDKEAAIAKLADLKKDKIRALIAQIPTEQAELFAWNMNWDLVDLGKVSAWIRKNVDAWEEVREKLILVEDLESWIAERLQPDAMLQNLEGLPAADLFIMRLWRYLVYETESTAHGIQ